MTPRPALPRPPMAAAAARAQGTLGQAEAGEGGREEHYETLINV